MAVRPELVPPSGWAVIYRWAGLLGDLQVGKAMICWAVIYRWARLLDHLQMIHRFTDDLQMGKVVPCWAVIDRWARL